MQLQTTVHDEKKSNRKAKQARVSTTLPRATAFNDVEVPASPLGENGHVARAALGMTPRSPEIAAATSTGHVREKNEDQFLVAQLQRTMMVHQASVTQHIPGRLRVHPQGWLLLVADGVGGHAQGDMASEVAVNTLKDEMLKRLPWTLTCSEQDVESLANALREAIERSQMRILERSDAKGISRTPGTTLTAGFVVWPHLFISHVGDSRVYLIRQGQLYRLTEDHTYEAQTDTDRGYLTDSVLSNVLTNAVGGHRPDLFTELKHVILEPEDVLFFCTDGVTSYLDDAELLERLGSMNKDGMESAEGCVRGILESGNERGGEDNLTAILARF